MRGRVSNICKIETKWHIQPYVVDNTKSLKAQLNFNPRPVAGDERLTSDLSGVCRSVGGSSRVFIGTDQKSDLYGGNNDEGEGKERQYCRKSGDRIVCRFVPEGFWLIFAYCCIGGLMFGGLLSWLAVWAGSKKACD